MATDIKNKRILVIVESPNKVKTISGILKNAGYTKAVVMASVGHISGIKNAKGSYKNTGIYPEDGFRMNIAVTDDKKEIVAKLKEQAKAAEKVYIMTDPDREGAQIAWSLVKFLKLPQDKYVRAVTHEITPKAVVAALENPIPLEDSLIEAAQARMVLDKMVGYALSPIARTYLGAKSVGRCQSAGLKLIVDREKEIAEFVPEKYFDLFLDFEKNGSAFRAKYVGTGEKQISRIPTPAAVERIKDECSGDFAVAGVTKKERKESPKPPFCTATFQQEVSSKLGLSVKSAMSCAQKLFEGIDVDGEHIGLITYHRTDSTEFAPEFLPTLKDYVDKAYGQGMYTSPRHAKKQTAEQDGHECLRCVDPNLTPTDAGKYLTNDLLLKVYKIIWRRTVASAMPDAKIAETVYDIENNGHRFTLTSSELAYAGYRQVYDYGEDDEGDAPMRESFSEGEILRNCELIDVAKQTQPPARYREATFVKELQQRGIGRPSTFAGILDTVISPTRGYCTLEDKQLVPTEKGIQLSKFLDRSFSSVINLDYTKEMEKDLDLIAAGELSKTDFLTSFYDGLEEAIKSNKETGPKQQGEAPTCPKCGAPMVMRRSRFGKLFYGCSNYPQCNGLKKVD